MKLKKSFYNSHIIRHELTYFGWIGVLYLIFLFMTGPVASLSGDEKFTIYMLSLLRFESPLHQFTIIVFPVALGLFQFKYLHSQVQISRIHSYPFSRYEWLGTKLLTGVFILFLPQMFFALFTIVFYPSAEAIGLQLVHSPLSFMLLNCFYMLNLYLFSALISIMSGFTIAATLITLIFFSVPYGLLTLIYSNLEMTLKGFYYNNQFLQLVILKLSPLTLLFELSADKISNMTYFTLLSFTVIFTGLIFHLYAMRKDEMAGDVLAFPVLKPVFTMGVTLCSAFVGGTYISVIYGTETALFVGYIIGGTLGYYISRMIIDKKLNVFRKYIKGYVFVLVGIVAFQSVLCFDITGFESKVPTIDRLDSVILEPMYFSQKDDKHMVYERAEDVETIRMIHQKLVDEEVESEHGKRFYIQYNLKNGTKVKRQYTIDELRYKDLFARLYGSESYKKQTYDIFDLSAEDISMALIESNEFWNNREKIESEGDIAKMLTLLQQDILDASAEELVFSRYDQAHIIFYDNRFNINVNVATNNSLEGDDLMAYDDTDDRAILVDVPLNSKFVRTKAWLDQTGILSKVALKPDAVSYIVLEEVGLKSNATTAINTESHTVNITNTVWINIILEHMSYGEYFDVDEPYFVVGVGLKEKLDGMVYAYVQKKDLPNDVLGLFE